MKKNTKTTPSYFAVATEFSLRSDGTWKSVGSNDFDILRTAEIIEATAWMRARTALKLGFTLEFDHQPIMTKNPGSHAVELYHEVV